MASTAAPAILPLSSARTPLMSWFLGVFHREMQMSFMTVIVCFPLHTMKGTVPCHPWGKIVQIYKDFVRMRKYYSVSWFTSPLWSDPAQKRTKHDSGVLVLWKHH